jgi:hypothetical protein
VLSSASIFNNAGEETFAEKNLQWISRHRKPKLI